ncbi:MAG: hypothetical protein KC619_22760 [Myxococcales bacterium]|nr:hypothetical protein [Myxococcales bacterium]
MREERATSQPIADDAEPPKEPAARVVYALPPISMGVVTSRSGRVATVAIGPHTCDVEIDPSVDTPLVDEALADGRRVIIDPATNTLCGVLQTRRSLSIDAHGAVTAELSRLDVSVREQAVVRSRESLFSLDDDRVELYARETLLRARDVVRALATLIKLN